MGLDQLIAQERVSPFTDEDRVMHTSKMVERTFGVELSTLGRVEMKNGQAALIFSANGADHSLSWARRPNGSIVWYLDGSDDPLVLGGSDRALARLLAHVES